MKKNKVIIALARGDHSSPVMNRLRLKIMEVNSRIDNRCATGQIIGDDDDDVLRVISLRRELTALGAKENLGSKPN